VKNVVTRSSNSSVVMDNESDSDQTMTAGFDNKEQVKEKLSTNETNDNSN